MGSVARPSVEKPVLDCEFCVLDPIRFAATLGEFDAGAWRRHLAEHPWNPPRRPEPAPAPAPRRRDVEWARAVLRQRRERIVALATWAARVAEERRSRRRPASRRARGT
jgi:hypothetical protein